MRKHFVFHPAGVLMKDLAIKLNNDILKINIHSMFGLKLRQ